MHTIKFSFDLVSRVVDSILPALEMFSIRSFRGFLEKKKKREKKKKEDEKKEKRRENGEMWLRSALPLAGTKRFEHGTPPSKDVNIPRC